MQSTYPIICDSECEKRKYADKIIGSPQTETPMPFMNDGIEEEDVIYVKNEVLDTSTEDSIKEVIVNIKKQLTVYSTQTESLEKMKGVRRKLLRENEKLKLTIRDNKSGIYTNDRKVVYEEWAKEWLFTIGIALRAFYLLVAGLYLYYGPFITNSGWKTVQGWIIPSILIVFPFLIYYISIGLQLLYDKLSWIMSNKVYKNVYV